MGDGGAAELSLARAEAKMPSPVSAMAILLHGCAGAGSATADDSGAWDVAPDTADPGSPDPDSGDAAPDLVDPLALAAEVSADEIATTIDVLAALGTRYHGTAGAIAARDWLLDECAALGLDAYLHEFDVEGTTAANVVAVHAGTEDPATIFVFQAHYDSTSNEKLTDAPGADDNASGVAAVLEAARILSTHPTRFTAWYVFTAAEELGSLGSAALVADAADEGADIRAVIAPDMIGYWPLGEGDAMDILGDVGSGPYVAAMGGWADALGVAHKDWEQHDYCYGDDHTRWQEGGFPAIAPMDCVEAHNVRGSGEDTPHYHRTTDTPATLHLGFTTKVVQVTTATFAEWVAPVAE